MKKKEYINYCFFISCLYFMFTACDLYNNDDFRVRIDVRSSKSETATVCIYIEGSDGQFVNGALVYAHDSQNMYTTISYEEVYACYSADIQIPQDSLLYFTVDSILFSEKKEYTIYHERMLVAPVISVFTDSAGNSALNGEMLDAALPIQVGWNAITENAVYKVSVRTALENVYMSSTKNTNIIIDGNTFLPNIRYYINIEIQKSYGDILFNDFNYYSVSICEGSNVGFSVE